MTTCNTFDRENFRPIRLVHSSEPRFLSEDSEAEVLGIERRRAAYPHQSELRSVRANALRQQAEERIAAQLAHDSKWWRVALRRCGVRI